MTRLSRWVVVLLGACHLAAASPAALADCYAARLSDGIAACRERVAGMVAPAEAAAARLAAGGQLYALGSLPGFDIEALNRAGGLGMLQRVTAKTTWRAGDVALYGLLGNGLAADVATIGQLRAQGVMVVAFGSRGAAAAAADTWVDTNVVDHGLAVTLPNGLRTAPLDGVLSVANLWAFSGELVAALTRLGKMPVILQSVFLPGARERNAALRGKPFDDRQAIAAVPAGQLGAAYLDRLAEHLEHLQRPAALEALARGGRQA
ncbi:MAG: hypothetical protein HUU35_07135, partial [Armatimonadetes bacterium]|nr:hypothetical protein [Armatimonadota bacterium]